MRTKLTLERANGSAADVVVVSDLRAAVADVAEALAAGDPRAASAPLTLAVVEEGRRRVLDGTQPFAEAAVPSGSRVCLATGETQAQPALGTLSVVSGPEVGRTFTLHKASTVVGRGAACDVRLDDTMISREHARIVISDAPGTSSGAQAHIVDLNSANGILLGEEQVRHADLGRGEVVVLGGSGIRVSLRADASSGPGRSDSDHNRSPRVQVVFEGEELEAPQPPQRARSRAFPVIAFLVPIAMGLAILAITRTPFVVLFIAMSPILLLGTWAETRFSEAREYRRALRDHEEQLTVLRGRLAQAADAERAARVAETPPVADVVAAVFERSSLLWSRRVDRPQWLVARLGLGRLPARARVVLPTRNAAEAALWAELDELAARSSVIEPVPVVVDLGAAGAFGVVGPTERAQAMADSVVLQLVGLHSPAELVVVAFTDRAGVARWSWLRWLPHTSSDHSPLAVPHLAGDAGSCRALLTELEREVAARRAGSSSPACVVLVDDDASVDRARLVWVAERGAEVGVHVVYVAARAERLPARCDTYVRIAPDGAGQLVVCRDGEVVDPVVLEPLPAEVAARAARVLSPVVDAGALVPSQSDLPESVSLVSLVGHEVLSQEERVRERWVASGSLPGPDGRLSPGQQHLSALVGMGPEGPYYLDLRRQGPHALVGGTTGAGKSEFLQTWVMGLAMTYSPRRVTFLFIDYKGGAAFGVCQDLPHAVGLITDLTPHRFGRTLISLRAELRRRERVLNEHKVKDLLELERRGAPDTPPSLVIVVDEFAALAQDLPEFVDSMVDIAQRGRSLGVHLILATQRPANVIKDNLRANTNLRVALRMADTADSTDVLGSPESGLISPDLPGRAYVRTGPGRLDAFQTAYAGGWTSDGPEPPSIVVEDLAFGPPAVWAGPASATADSAVDPEAPTDLELLADVVGRATERARLAPAVPPWLPPLGPAYALEKMTVNPGELPLAQRDDPEQQKQYAVGFDPDREGNLGVFGTGGSGKSTLLRSLATAAWLRTVAGDPMHVYGVDFGAGGLALIDRLPHVGAVIAREDTDLLARLLRWLGEQVRSRAERYQKAGAATLSDYRRNANAPAEPRILLMVDGAQVFRSEHESRSGLWEQFVRIAVDGRAVGVHVALAADRPVSLPGSLNSALQKRVYLRMAQEDYALIGLAGSALPADAPAGRGHLDGFEVQVGVFRAEQAIDRQGAQLDELAGSSRMAGPAPRRIERLPDSVRLLDLPAQLGGDPVLGLDDLTLEPVSVKIRSTFLVAGPPDSGRSTTVGSVAAAVLRAGRCQVAAYLGLERSPVSSMVRWTARATDRDQIVELTEKLTAALEDRAHPPTLVVVEDLHEVASGPAEAALLQLARRCIAEGHVFLTDVGANAKMFSELSQLIKAQQQGILLRPGLADGSNLLFTTTPAADRGDPRGRGYLVSGGRASKLQIGFAEPLG
ncbi:FtsK/SpoIIIE domain-containing protein [Spongisporangium articulatum]|uniref:FtsK/SpoIIIE domain-containing protein n=1 Tax=Spongisporangium articulatum TaxID=3362603 RepID=A0ABW8AT17_9ACTN